MNSLSNNFSSIIFLLPDNACAKKEPEPQVEKATDEHSEPSSSSDKSSKSGVGNDFSSDEAKESEGDSDPAQWVEILQKNLKKMQKLWRYFYFGAQKDSLWGFKK